MGATSLKEIAEQTGVSRRSVYYDICNINEWLEEHGIRELETERGKGLLIPEEDKSRIADLLEEKPVDDYYVFLPSERVKIIICCVIYSKEPVYIEQLMDACQVSRNTVFGGLGSAVCECVCEDCAVPVKRIGVRDVFGESGTAESLLKKHGLDSDGIYKKVLEMTK